MKVDNAKNEKSLFYIRKMHVFEGLGIIFGYLKIRKIGVWILRRFDLGSILASILGAKINKKQIENQCDFGVVQKSILGGFGAKNGSGKVGPAECARLLETLKESERVCRDLERVSRNTPCTSQARAADSIASRIPPGQE